LVLRPDLLLFPLTFLPSRFTLRSSGLEVSAFWAALALLTIVPIEDPIDSAMVVNSPSPLLRLPASAFIGVLLFIHRETYVPSDRLKLH
jgi:hypothetical protein